MYNILKTTVRSEQLGKSIAIDPKKSKFIRYNNSSV